MPELTGARQLLAAARRSPVLFVWAAYVLAIPFYVSKSGIPQPGNLILIVLVPTTLLRWNGRMRSDLIGPLRILLWFTVWVCVVNFGWAIALWKWNLNSYAIYATYYVYNAIVVIVVLLLYQRHEDVFLRLTMAALFVSLAIQVVASLVFPSRDADIRGSGFFNNPNQLGYYALLVACVVALCQRRLKLNVIYVSSMMLSSAYLAFLSASRAAVGGIAILFALMIFTNRRVLILSVVAVVAMFAVSNPLSSIVDATGQRIEYRRKENVLEARGYDRVWRFKEYVVLGAGEGDLGRFTDNPSQAIEIHSSAATVLFSYGIVGAILFLTFVSRLLRGATLRSAMLVVPVGMYTVTHQGLRFTMLWVLLSFFLVLKTTK